MAKERIIGFKIQVEGSEQIVKTIGELEKAVRETNKELKKADIGSVEYSKLNTELASAKKQLFAVRKEQRELLKETKATVNPALGSYDQLKAQLTEAKNEFKSLSREAREGAFGQEVLFQIQRLTAEIKDVDGAIKSTLPDLNDLNKGLEQAKPAAGSYDELKARITALRNEFKGLSAEARESVAGDEILGQIRKLDQEIKTVDASLKVTEQGFVKVETVAENSILGLENKVKELNKELKKTEFGTDEYKRLSDAVAVTTRRLDNIRKTQREATKEIGKIENAPGSYRELNKQLVAARREFKELGQEARDGIAGQQLLNQIQQLDTQLKELDKTIGLNQRNVGNYSSAFDGLGGSISGGISGIASFAFGAAGLGVAGELLIEGAQQVAQLTEEFRVLRGEIERLTGATGQSLDAFTSSISAIATTFQVETDEVLQSANTLSKELGIGFGEALTAIEKGFVAGANANGEFLDSLREYSTQARAAGIDTAEFISILNQSGREGVFSDKGIDAVKEFGLRIREQTKATRESLTAAFGDQFTNELFENLNSGAISTVDALKQVTGQINASQLPANQLQAIITDVFGGPGEDAGIRFLSTLENINGSLDELEGASSNYAQQQARILELNKELAAAQNELSKELSGGSQEFQGLFLQVKTFVIEGLIVAIRNIKFLATGFVNIAKSVRDFVEGNKLLSLTIGTAARAFFALTNVFNIFLNDIPAQFAGFQAAAGQAIDNVKGFFRGLILSAQIASQELNLALSIRSETKDKIREALIDLKKQQTDAAESGRTIGEAFNEAFQKVVDERKVNVTPSEQLNNNFTNLNKELDKTPKKVDKVTKATKELRKEQVNSVDEIERKRVSSIESTAKTDEQIQLESIRKIREANEEAIRQQNFKRIEDAEKTAERLEEIEEQRRQATIQAGITAAQTLADTAFQIAANKAQQEKETELQILNEQEQTELSRFEGNEAKQEEIKAEFEAKREKLELDASKAAKKRAVSQAIINGALAVTNALATVQPLVPAGLLAAGLVTLTTAAQLAVINSQKFASGGILSGASHAAGGIKTPFGEMEGGEAVINKRSTAAFRPLLSAINEAGGGVRFQNGGIAGAPLPLPRISAVTGTQDAFVQLAMELREESQQTRALALAVRNQVITQRVILDTEELETAQTTRVSLDNARTL